MSNQLERGPLRTTLADVLLASVGERGVLCDFYDEDAADIYRDVVHDDAREAEEYAARAHPTPGPVLELGAGTGRLTFPLLSLGWEITALELSATMCALLRRRLADAPASLRNRCTVVRGDMTAFSLDKRFGTVVMSPGTINLLSAADRPNLYASVRDHLAPGGQFLLAVPEKDESRPVPLERRQELPGRSGRRYVLHSRLISADEGHEITIYPVDETVDPFVVCTSRVGLVDVDQIVRELGEAGFDVIERTPLGIAEGPRHGLIAATPSRSDPA